MNEVEMAWQEYLKALNACCDCVNLVALNTWLCAEYAEDTARLVKEIVANTEKIKDGYYGMREL